MTVRGSPWTNRPAVVRERARAEVGAVLAACGTYVTMELLGLPKVWSFAFMGVALAAFVVWVTRRGGARWRDFGFRADTLRQSAIHVGAGTAVGVAALMVWALVADRSPWTPNTAVLLLLYLPYGLFQQAVFQGVLLRRLRELLPSRSLAILLAAGAFAAVHIGYAELLALTAVAGLFWSWSFARSPNVWTVGFSHGLLAALAYPLALGDDPLARIGG